MTQNVSVSYSTLLLHLKNDLTVARTPRWHELDLFDDSGGRLIETLQSRLRYLVKEGYPNYMSPVRSIRPLMLALKNLPDSVQLHRVSVTLQPPERGVNWRHSVDLTFDVLVWPVQDVWIAAVPLLGIEMLLKDRLEWNAKIEERIRKVLLIRYGDRLGWRELLDFRQVRSSELHNATITAECPAFPEDMRRELGHALQNEQREQWEELGVDFLDSARCPRAFEVGSYMDRLREEVFAGQPRPILLVGPGGVGKTAIWHEFVRRMLRETGSAEGGEISPSSYRYGETDASQLVTNIDDEGCCDWQSTCDLLVRLATLAPTVLHFGNLWELTQVGMWEGQTRSLGHYLIPAAAERFPFFCECTPEQLAVLEQEHPALLFPFTKFEIDEPDETTAISIYRCAAENEFPGLFDEKSVRKIDALHRRYATYSAAPGRALVFLHQMGSERKALEAIWKNPFSENPPDFKPDENGVITAADVVRAFSRRTGLPLVLLEDSIPLNAAETKNWFASRIIGQGDADTEGEAGGPISVIVDLLLTYKARLSRPDGPIASLLFVGPTGVGKTETAKTLAEFLYGDPRRLLRIDMSEYAEYGAAERLIRGSVRGEGLLTAKVRQQPFSVILLDEFEKAHEEVFDLLLQVLGEGRLTDAGGRVADFRNSVILMTSNLGVERFGLPKPGFVSLTGAPVSSVSTLASVDHFTAEAARMLRPEMLNRIDRIVPFHPLSKKSLRKILDIQIAGLSRRHGLAARSLSLEIEEPVYGELVEKGYDPRFGARPLRRVLERRLLLPLAESLQGYAPETPVRARVDLSDGNIVVTTSVSGNSVRQAERRTGGRRSLADLTRLRRRIRQLDEHSFLDEMRSRAKRAETIERRMERGRRKKRPKPVAEESLRFLGHVDRIDRPFLARMGQLRRDVLQLEESALLAYFRNEISNTEFESIEREYQRLVFDLLQESRGESNRVLVAVYASPPKAAFKLAELYENTARLLGLRVNHYALEPFVTPNLLKTMKDGDVLLFHGEELSQVRQFRQGAVKIGEANWKKYENDIRFVLARKIDDDSPLTLPGRSQPARLLEITGSRAGFLFAEEFGKHRLQHVGSQKQSFECSVEISSLPLAQYFPQIDSRGNPRITDPCIRRTIDFAPDTSRRDDAVYDAASLQMFLENRMARLIEDWVDE